MSTLFSTLTIRSEIKSIRTVEINYNTLHESYKDDLKTNKIIVEGDVFIKKKDKN